MVGELVGTITPTFGDELGDELRDGVASRKAPASKVVRFDDLCSSWHRVRLFLSTILEIISVNLVN
jgi:hypothetical protein